MNEFVDIDNEMFHLMLDSPYEGMVYVDRKGLIRYVNDSFARYNKMTPSQMIGQHYTIFADKNISRLLETQGFEALTFTDIGNRKFITSRRPVYRGKDFLGLFSQYFSITPRDVYNRKFGRDYINLISGLEIGNIMHQVAETIVELDTYKDEFNQANKAKRGVDHIIGNSPAIRNLKKKILLLSNSPSSVLITGESGTGKELFAQAIHFHGNRSVHPFVKVNCAAIPEALLESELFGYVNGAFTGARKGGKMGKFELANKGTILLDEIGDMPMLMQAKLLRVLQEREVERVGCERTIPVDIRIISATNKNLFSMVEKGTFREDLYYRLNVVDLHIPPLRERKSDIPEIIDYGIRELNKNLKQSIRTISPDALNLLLDYDWPGNIRELKNVLEATMNFCHSCVIETDALPYFLHSRAGKRHGDNGNKKVQGLQDAIEDAEREQVLLALEQCRGIRKDAAAILNLSKSTLYRLMKKHDLI